MRSRFLTLSLSSKQSNSFPWVHASKALLLLALGALEGVSPSSAWATPPLKPQLDKEKPISCGVDADGRAIRFQCDPSSRVCLYYVDLEIGRDGSYTSRSLDRTDPCDDYVNDLAKARVGYTWEEARAESPYGWSRDERNRSFQVMFDLDKRFYLGVGYAPAFVGTDLLSPLSAMSQEGANPLLETGFVVAESDGDGDAWRRNRVELATGKLYLEPLGYDLTSFTWHHSTSRDQPLMRITTFVGPPTRHDLYADTGVSLELFRFIEDPYLTPDITTMRWFEPGLYWMLAHRHEMSDYLRFHLKTGLEHLTYEENVEQAVTVTAALQGHVALGDNGFRHLALELSAGTATYFGGQGEAIGAQGGLRATGRLEYERILLAINDQPISLLIRAEAGYRGDLVSGPAMDYLGVVGLRYSFWAPAPSRYDEDDMRPLAPDFGEDGIEEGPSDAPLDAPLDAPSAAPTTDEPFAPLPETDPKSQPLEP